MTFGDDMYEILFILENSILRIPVNPETLSLASPADNKTYNILDLGEIVVPQTPALCEISWESFFPQNIDEIVNTEGLKKPMDYVDAFNGFKTFRQVVTLTVNRAINDEPQKGFNLDVVVENFEIIEKGGEPGDIYYSISLKEYRHYMAKTITLERNNDGEVKAVTSNQREQPKNVITIGSNVAVTGQLYRDSFGNAPGRVLEKYSGKINLIADGRKCPYHITTPDGAWLGWVAVDSVTGQ